MIIDLSQIPGHINDSDIKAIEHITTILPNEGILVEFGTFFGKSAICWAQNFRKHKKKYKIYTLDSFALTPKSILKTCGSQSYFIESKKLIWPFLLGNIDHYDMAYNFLKEFPEIEIIKYNLFLDNPDLLNIKEITCFFNDGNHTEAGVKQCYIDWFPKVIAGGYFAGHDYKNPDYQHVEIETDILAQNNDLQVVQPIETSSVFYIKKPNQ